jgi:hypothetical protein
MFVSMARGMGVPMNELLPEHGDMTLAALPIEADLAALLADGHTRTRATELATEKAVARASDAVAVVLVEGLSDAIAMEIIAARCDRRLRDERVAVVPMGGVTNIGRFMSLFGRRAREVKIAGLYDVGAHDHVCKVLESEWPGRVPARSGLEALGFYACVEDLEDEFIRSLGVAAVEQIVERQGQIRSFRKMQHEPHHRGRIVSQQIHQFVGRWRYRYARLLAEAVDVRSIPRPVESVLEYVGR